MNEAVNRALTLRKEKILKFGTTAAECVKMCESRCDEFEKGKNMCQNETIRTWKG